MNPAQVPAGYSRAGYIITRFDEGDHSANEALLRCHDCAALVISAPDAVKTHTEFHVRVASELAQLRTAADPRQWGWRDR